MDADGLIAAPVLCAHRAGPAALAALVEQTVARTLAGWPPDFLPGRAVELVAALLAGVARDETARLQAHQAGCPAPATCAWCALWWWLDEEDRVGIRGALIAATGTRTLLQDEAELAMSTTTASKRWHEGQPSCPR